MSSTKNPGLPADTGKKVPPQSNTIQKKLESANSKVAKALETAAANEAKIKEMKATREETSAQALTSAEKFQQNVANTNERKDIVSLKNLKNFKRQRKTIFETPNIQTLDVEIDKLINETTLPDGQQDDEEIIDERGPFIFDDSEFGPNDKDPSGLKSIGPTISQKASTLRWPKMADIANMGKAYFIEDMEAIANGDNSFWVKKIIQGRDNLNFLNALILTVSHNDLFNRLFDPSFIRYFRQGIYPFRFYKNNNQTYYVIVDDKIPAIQKPSGEYVPFGARSDNNSEFWISLIEKAYAKLHLNYENTCSPNLTLQDHFFSLTSIMVEEIPIDPSRVNSFVFWELLLNYKKYNLPMACKQDSDEEPSIPIINGHIYIITDVFLKEGRNIIQLANPWANAADLVESEDNNGIYDIDYDVFLNSFSTLLLVKDFPENWQGIKFDCEIRGSKGGPNTQSNSWVENPQYVFEILDKVEGNIILRMNRYVGIQSLNLDSLGSNFGFALFSLLSNEPRIRIPDFKRIVNITKSNENQNGIVLHLKLGKGKYSLIPFTAKEGEEASFYLELFFDYKENMIDYTFKNQIEKVLERSFVKLPQWKPRVLKDTLRIQDFEGSVLNGACESILLLIPYTTSKIIYKEETSQKPTAKTLKEEAKPLSRGMSKTLGSGKNPGAGTSKLFDPKLDGYKDFEITAGLFGLDESDVNRTSVKNKQGNDDGGAGDEIDPEILQSLEDTVDMSDYGLTDEGVLAVIDPIVLTKTIRVLNLSGNKITDKVIFNLVDSLEKSHHFELEELDLSNNNIGKGGADILLEMTKTFKKLTKIDLTGNKDVPELYRNKIKNALLRKSLAK